MGFVSEFELLNWRIIEYKAQIRQIHAYTPHQKYTKSLKSNPRGNKIE